MEDRHSNVFETINTRAKTNKLSCTDCEIDISEGEYITISVENGILEAVYCFTCSEQNGMGELARHEQALNNAFGIGQW